MPTFLDHFRGTRAACPADSFGREPAGIRVQAGRLADPVQVADAASHALRQDGAAWRSTRHRSGRLMPQQFDLHRFHQWVLARLAPQKGPP